MPTEEAIKEIEKLVDDWGAPESQTNIIKDFLFESLNIYQIIEICKEIND